MKKHLLLIVGMFLFIGTKNLCAQVVLEANFPNNTSDSIGTFQGIKFREGGFSGLNYIPNTNGKEFWTVSDRGVNVDAASANLAACRPTYDKIYGFANYAPKIHRIRIEGTELKIMQTITIKRPNGTGATGILNPTGYGSTAAEVVSTDTVKDCANFAAKTVAKDIWGIDSEGIDVDSDGNFWVCEEQGATVWKLNKNGVVLNRYTPYANLAGKQAEDIAIDTCFKFRVNNRGFEGITITPNRKVYAIIQSPLAYPTAQTKSRIHRLLEIDPKTNTSKMYAYVNDGYIGPDSTAYIRPSDQKMGDLKAINDTTFLAIEQAARGGQDVKRIYKFSLNGATAVQSGAAYGGKTLEQLLDEPTLAANSVKPVKKTLFFDLYQAGWPTALDKAEGLAIVNDSTIVVANDNDYSQASPTANGVATETGKKCEVYVFKLRGSSKLTNYVPNNATIASSPNVVLEGSYPNLTSATIGTFQGITFREGGFSGLNYIPNTAGKEFWTVSDRGVNVDAANANLAACRPTYDKIYGFPTYAPKIHKLKIEGSELKITETITIKRPNGTTATGVLNPAGFGSTATEVVSTDTVQNCANFNTKTAAKDIWGIDSEGIDVGKDGNFWICEEQGATVWKVNKNGVVINRFTPYANLAGKEAQDMAIDTCFKYRRNNRGFEGITVTPNGKVYAIIQSPMYYPVTIAKSQIHRILEIDPINNTSKMYAYVNDGYIGPDSTNYIRPADQKMGDLKAINDTTFLVIEQAARGGQDVKRIYRISLKDATVVQSGAAYGGKTLEQLLDAPTLAANNVKPATKTLLFDMLEEGWPSTLDKAEGLTILNDSTLVIGNDNDYGQFSPTENGVATETGKKCELYIFSLKGAAKLTNYVANNNLVSSIFDNHNTAEQLFVYPNPTTGLVTLKNVPEGSTYHVFDMIGKPVLSGKTSATEFTINLGAFNSGIYFLKVGNQLAKLMKE